MSVARNVTTRSAALAQWAAPWQQTTGSHARGAPDQAVPKAVSVSVVMATDGATRATLAGRDAHAFASVGPNAR
jgi:hypothetical protein